jgi:hypothetical protein
MPAGQFARLRRMRVAPGVAFVVVIVAVIMVRVVVMSVIVVVMIVVGRAVAASRSR